MSLKRTQSKYAGLINMTAPISSLPNEILRIIFEAGEAMSLDTADSEPRFEMVVSHVCSRFRAISLQTPILWTIIEASPIQPTEIIETYLLRSKACPLDIRLDFYGDPEDEYSDGEEGSNLQSVLSLLLPHSDRWKRVFIQSAHMTTFHIIARHLRSLAVPSLEHYSVSIADGCSDDVEYFAPVFSGGSPLLSILRLGGGSLHCSWPSFASVTTIHLHDVVEGQTITYRQFVDMIAAAPLLKSLSIYRGVVGWPGVNPKPVTLPHLEFLRLHGPNRWFSELFLTIKAPLLKSLSLTNIRASELERFFDTASAMTPNTLIFPDLESLTIRAINFLDDEYVKISRFFPNITTLELYSSFLGNSSSQVSAWPTPPWPDLQILRLRGNFLEKEVLDMTAARASVGHPIQKLCFDQGVLNSGGGKLSPEGLEWLRSHLEVEGIRAPPLNDWEKIYEYDPF